MLILRRRKTKSYALQDLSAGLPNYNPAAMALFALNTNYTGAGYDPHYITVEEAANMPVRLVYQVLYLTGYTGGSTAVDTSVTTFNEYRYFLQCTRVGDGFPEAGINYPVFTKLRGLTELTLPPTTTRLAMRDVPIFRRSGYYSTLHTLRLSSDANLDLSLPLHTKYSGTTQCDVIFAGDNPNLTYTADGLVYSASALKYVPPSYQGEVVIPQGITSQDVNVFRECARVTKITNCQPWAQDYSDSARIASAYEFYGCTALTEIDIPSGVKYIGGYMFYGCTALARVSLPNTVIAMGGGGDATGHSFRYCTSLADITLPNSLVSITGGDIFYGCTALASVILSDSMTSIGNSMFYGCTSLMPVVIPQSVTSIGTYAFRNCRFQSITLLPTTPPTLGASAFLGCTNLSAIYVPASSVSAYQTASGWSEYASMIQAIPT